jgi:hypothetical protein
MVEVEVEVEVDVEVYQTQEDKLIQRQPTNPYENEDP